MDVNIKFDVNDVAKEIAAEVERHAKELVRNEIKAIENELTMLIEEQAKQLNDILSIKDMRQRERIRKALTHSLDKWTKGVLNGK